MRIVRYLMRHKWRVLLIICLLVVQAFCALALPGYTSDIVDIGIQNGGIEYSTPVRIRRQTLSELELFMAEEDIIRVETAYEPGEDGVLVLREDSDRAALGGIFDLPMAMLAQLRSGGQYNIDDIKAALEAGLMTKEELLARAAQALSAMGMLSDSSVVSAAAAAFLQGEYQAMGMDVHRLRMDYLWGVGLKMVGVTFLMAAAAILVSLLGSRVAAAIGRDLREGIYSRVLSFSAAEIDRFSAASLITRSTNDIQQIQIACVMLLQTVMYAPILGVGGVIKVAGTKTGMGWIIGVGIGSLMLLVGILLKVAMPKFKKIQELMDRLNLIGREILTGLPVIRAFNRERYEEQRFGGANHKLMRTQLFTSRAMAFMMPTMMFIMFGITVMIEWFGAKGIDLGRLQVGDMIAFMNYTMLIVMAFMMITMISIFLPRALVAAGRVDEVIETMPEIVDWAETRDDELREAGGTVAFEDVTFHYPGAEKELLRQISFTAGPGRTTAIIGSTGCGKSTLVKLLLRFYDVTGGRITIDGVDIRELSQKKLRSLIGYVPQRGVLFSGDIESNLKYGGEHISDEAMVEAAEIAQAASFIAEKEGGYNSPVAQGGTNVSGGQRQRLSIARAIAKAPKIYIFDDSFSALDFRTESALRRALKKKLAGATVIIVAQRISTILHADCIVVMNEGRIEGIGTHAELLKSCETYREIARSQLSAEELGEEQP